ncbi:MAG: hypothetical protein ACRCY4_05500 [Brevinema sp.]
MKNRLWLLSLTLILIGCSVAPNEDFVLKSIDTSAEAQARFKTEWLTATQGKVFEGLPDIYGGGGSEWFSVFAFDSAGNLHNTSRSLQGWTDEDGNLLPGAQPQGYAGLHRIVMFYSGSQAVVAFYKSAASPKLHSEIYALEISNNTLYRTSY